MAGTSPAMTSIARRLNFVGCFFGQALRMRSVGGRQATYGSFLIAQDTLTVTCSVSSPCATAAPDTAMGAATLR
jgi:hypothetical protein